MAQKKLAWGYTTGTCAQAATKAAMQMLFTGEQADHIQVGLPNGEMLTLELYDIKIAYAAQEDRLPSSVSCAVKRIAGMTRISPTACWYIARYSGRKEEKESCGADRGLAK